jgi:predicted O-methyltransferase YrrM
MNPVRSLRQRLSRYLARNEQPPPPESTLAPLDEPFRSALLSLYRGEPQLGNEGKLYPTDPITGIDAPSGMWLYEEYRRVAPRASLEIGMAYGCSTLFFLAAIAKIGAGAHTAIDPYERDYWNSIGLEKVRQVGSNAFQFIRETDVHAAADLHRAGKSFDFIFIDGSHRFDDAFVDFTLFAPLLNNGGRILFDDVWMPSIRATLSFIQTNRADFKHIPVPPGSRFAMFQRIAADTRDWKHFVPFRASE